MALSFPCPSCGYAVPTLGYTQIATAGDAVGAGAANLTPELAECPECGTSLTRPSDEDSPWVRAESR